MLLWCGMSEEVDADSMFQCLRKSFGSSRTMTEDKNIWAGLDVEITSMSNGTRGTYSGNDFI